MAYLAHGDREVAHLGQVRVRVRARARARALTLSLIDLGVGARGSKC